MADKLAILALLLVLSFSGCNDKSNAKTSAGENASNLTREIKMADILEPIHGISFEDYAQMAMKLTSGASEEQICKAMGIDSAVWDEVNTLWTQRMKEDATFKLVTLYGQYWSAGVTNPKLANLEANVSPEGKANLERIKTDRYFYEELCGARNAAYAYGLDGAQWILENFGITLGDFQSVAMQYMSKRANGEEDIVETKEFLEYQQEKQKEYEAKFAAQRGGDIAGDIEF
ncbi:MAG: hypothetical protein LBB59_05870 [Campylobacteraceae bacterium]|jgi:hypothetical protein|nr:hypothetical protein [Campylobacteraceae bacterium]